MTGSGPKAQGKSIMRTGLAGSLVRSCQADFGTAGDMYSTISELP